jgi:hypothetical protein
MFYFVKNKFTFSLNPNFDNLIPFNRFITHPDEIYIYFCLSSRQIGTPGHAVGGLLEREFALQVRNDCRHSSTKKIMGGPSSRNFRLLQGNGSQMSPHSEFGE